MEEDARTEGITIHFQALELSPFSLHVNSNISIQDLREFIRERLALEEDTRVRMIYNGQLLEEGYSVSDYGVLHNSTVLLAMSQRRRRSLSDSTDSDDGEEIGEMEPAFLRGFDRFRRDDIEVIRSQFFNTLLNGTSNVNNNLSANLRRNPMMMRSVEEAFLENVISRQARLDDGEEEEESEDEVDDVDEGENDDEETAPVRFVFSDGGDIQVLNSESDDESEEGSYMDLFFGLMMGFLLSFTMLFFWFSDKSLSTRLKFGILAGVGCNLSFGLIHFSKSFNY